MIGENLIVKPEYLKLSYQLLEAFEKAIHRSPLNKVVIGIAGESGSGKSVTAKGLELVMQKKGINVLTLHQDGYFHLPPLTNHKKRLSGLTNVGVQEVNLELLNGHIKAFKDNESVIGAPIVNYDSNSIETQSIDIKDISVLIVEGTYVLSLEHLDWKLFLESDYIQTRKSRKRRNRETWTSFIEEVLKIEHKTIKQHKKLADIIINQEFKLSNNIS